MESAEHPQHMHAMNSRIVNPNGGTATERTVGLVVSSLGLVLVMHQLNILGWIYAMTRYIVLGIVAFVLMVDCCCFRRPESSRACDER